VIGTFDAVRIRQLLENLVGNGVKYSPDGGEIVIRVRAEGPEAILEVSDQGIGIPRADLPLLFSRFHRAANVDDRQFQGMGLGLYFCRAIVEAHGGTISVTSEIGTGTTFQVRLPLSQPQPAMAEPAQPAAEVVAAAEATRG
jgi:two-component system sensor histidine kinase BaeS